MSPIQRLANLIQFDAVWIELLQNSLQLVILLLSPDSAPVLGIRRLNLHKQILSVFIGKHAKLGRHHFQW